MSDQKLLGLRWYQISRYHLVSERSYLSSPYTLEKIALPPDDAVNGLARSAPDGAHGERLGCFLGCAVVARGNALLDDLNLAIETSSATLNERNIGSQAHLVHMSPSLKVVQSIEGNAKLTKPCDSKLVILDVSMVGDDLDVGVESLRSLFGDLHLG